MHTSLPEFAGVAGMPVPGSAVSGAGGYYRVGPLSAVSVPWAAGHPQVGVVWRTWPWLPALNPFLLMAHSSPADKLYLVVDGVAQPVTDRALGSWLRLLPELSVSVRPVEDPLVLLTCSSGLLRQRLADQVGRVVWFPHGGMTVGPGSQDPAGGARWDTHLHSGPDGRGGRFRSVYPQGPAGDRVRWAYRSRFGSDPAGWLVEHSASPGDRAPARSRPYLFGGEGVLVLCYFDRRDRQSRSAALNAPLLGSSHVAWTPDDAYQPGTGASRAATGPWHGRELGPLPFGLGNAAVVVGYFAGGRFAVADRRGVTYWETPQAFGRRVRQDLATARGPLPSRLLLLTDFDTPPAMAREQVARGLGGPELITVNTPSTLYLDEDTGGVPHARIALLPATSGATPPVWTVTTSAGISTTLPPAPGRQTSGAGVPALPAQRLLAWAPKRAGQRQAELARGADLADDCVPLAAEGFAVAYGRTGNRRVEAEDITGGHVIASKNWLGLMNLLHAVPEPWPDPATVTKTLTQGPERLAVVRLARPNNHDHVILLVHGKDPEHPDRTGIWQIDFATTPAERRITPPELTTLLGHASAVALLDGNGVQLSLSDTTDRNIPDRAALPDPGASPAATGNQPTPTPHDHTEAPDEPARETGVDLPLRGADPAPPLNPAARPVSDAPRPASARPKPGNSEPKPLPKDFFDRAYNRHANPPVTTRKFPESALNSPLPADLSSFLKALAAEIKRRDENDYQAEDIRLHVSRWSQYVSPGTRLAEHARLEELVKQAAGERPKGARKLNFTYILHRINNKTMPTQLEIVRHPTADLREAHYLVATSLTEDFIPYISFLPAAGSERIALLVSGFVGRLLPPQATSEILHIAVVNTSRGGIAARVAGMRKFVRAAVEKMLPGTENAPSVNRIMTESVQITPYLDLKKAVTMVLADVVDANGARVSPAAEVTAVADRIAVSGSPLTGAQDQRTQSDREHGAAGLPAGEPRGVVSSLVGGVESEAGSEYPPLPVVAGKVRRGVVEPAVEVDTWVTGPPLSKVSGDGWDDFKKRYAATVKAAVDGDGAGRPLELPDLRLHRHIKAFPDSHGDADFTRVEEELRAAAKLRSRGLDAQKLTFDRLTTTTRRGRLFEFKVYASGRTEQFYLAARKLNLSLAHTKQEHALPPVEARRLRLLVEGLVQRARVNAVSNDPSEQVRLVLALVTIADQAERRRSGVTAEVYKAVRATLPGDPTKEVTKKDVVAFVARRIALQVTTTTNKDKVGLFATITGPWHELDAHVEPEPQQAEGTQLKPLPEQFFDRAYNHRAAPLVDATPKFLVPAPGSPLSADLSSFSKALAAEIKRRDENDYQAVDIRLHVSRWGVYVPPGTRLDEHARLEELVEQAAGERSEGARKLNFTYIVHHAKWPIETQLEIAWHLTADLGEAHYRATTSLIEDFIPRNTFLPAAGSERIALLTSGFVGQLLHPQATSKILRIVIVNPSRVGVKPRVDGVRKIVRAAVEEMLPGTENAPSVNRIMTESVQITPYLAEKRAAAVVLVDVVTVADGVGASLGSPLAGVQDQRTSSDRERGEGESSAPISLEDLGLPPIPDAHDDALEWLGRARQWALRVYGKKSKEEVQPHFATALRIVSQSHLLPAGEENPVLDEADADTLTGALTKVITGFLVKGLEMQARGVSEKLAHALGTSRVPQAIQDPSRARDTSAAAPASASQSTAATFTDAGRPVPVQTGQPAFAGSVRRQRQASEEALSSAPDWVTDWWPDLSPGSPTTLIEFLVANDNMLPEDVSPVPDENGVLQGTVLIWIRAWFLKALKTGGEEIGRIDARDVAAVIELVSAQPVTGVLPGGEDVFSVPGSLSHAAPDSSAVPPGTRAKAQAAMTRGRQESRARVEDSDDVEMVDAPAMDASPRDGRDHTEQPPTRTPDDAPAHTSPPRDIEYLKRWLVAWQRGTDGYHTLSEFITGEEKLRTTFPPTKKNGEFTSPETRNAVHEWARELRGLDNPETRRPITPREAEEWSGGIISKDFVEKEWQAIERAERRLLAWRKGMYDYRTLRDYITRDKELRAAFPLTKTGRTFTSRQTRNALHKWALGLRGKGKDETQRKITQKDIAEWSGEIISKSSVSTAWAAADGPKAAPALVAQLVAWRRVKDGCRTLSDYIAGDDRLRAAFPVTKHSSGALIDRGTREAVREWAIALQSTVHPETDLLITESEIEVWSGYLITPHAVRTAWKAAPDGAREVSGRGNDMGVGRAEGVAQSAAAAKLGLRLVDVALSFYAAVLRTVPRSVWVPRLESLGKEQSPAGLRQAVADAYRRLRPYDVVLIAVDGPGIEDRIRTPGHWDSESGDIAMRLVPDVLGVNLKTITRAGDVPTEGVTVHADRSTYYLAHNGGNQYLGTEPGSGYPPLPVAEGEVRLGVAEPAVEVDNWEAGPPLSEVSGDGWDDFKERYAARVKAAVAGDEAGRPLELPVVHLHRDSRSVPDSHGDADFTRVEEELRAAAKLGSPQFDVQKLTFDRLTTTKRRGGLFEVKVYASGRTEQFYRATRKLNLSLAHAKQKHVLPPAETRRLRLLVEGLVQRARVNADSNDPSKQVRLVLALVTTDGPAEQRRAGVTAEVYKAVRAALPGNPTKEVIVEFVARHIALQVTTTANNDKFGLFATVTGPRHKLDAHVEPEPQQAEDTQLKPLPEEFSDRVHNRDAAPLVDASPKFSVPAPKSAIPDNLRSFFDALVAEIKRRDENDLQPEDIWLHAWRRGNTPSVGTQLKEHRRLEELVLQAAERDESARKLNFTYISHRAKRATETQLEITRHVTPDLGDAHYRTATSLTEGFVPRTYVLPSAGSERITLLVSGFVGRLLSPQATPDKLRISVVNPSSAGVEPRVNAALKIVRAAVAATLSRAENDPSVERIMDESVQVIRYLDRKALGVVLVDVVGRIAADAAVSEQREREPLGIPLRLTEGADVEPEAGSMVTSRVSHAVEDPSRARDVSGAATAGPANDPATVTDVPTELAHGSLTDIGSAPGDADVVGWRPGTGRPSTLKEFLTKPGQTDVAVEPSLLRQWVLGLQEESVEQTGMRLPTAIIIDLSGNLVNRGQVLKWNKNVPASKSDDEIRLNLPPLVKEFRPKKGAEGVSNLWTFFQKHENALPLAVRLGLRESYRNEGPIFRWTLAWARIVQEESISLTGMRIPTNRLSTSIGVSIDLGVLKRLSANVTSSDSVEALKLAPDWVKKFRPGRDFSDLLSLLASKDAAGELPLAVSPESDNERGRYSQATMAWARACVLAVAEEDRQEGRPRRSTDALSKLTGGIASPGAVNEWLQVAERVTAARVGEGSGAPRETLEPVGTQGGGGALGAVGGSRLGDTGSVSFDSGAPFAVDQARKDLQVSQPEAIVSAGSDHDVEDQPTSSDRERGEGESSAPISLEDLGLPPIPDAHDGALEWLGGARQWALRAYGKRPEEEVQSHFATARGIVSQSHRLPAGEENPVRDEAEADTLTGALTKVITGFLVKGLEMQARGVSEKLAHALGTSRVPQAIQDPSRARDTSAAAPASASQSTAVSFTDAGRPVPVQTGRPAGENRGAGAVVEPTEPATVAVAAVEPADVVKWRPGDGGVDSLKAFLASTGRSELARDPKLLREWVLSVQQESVERTGMRVPEWAVVKLSGGVLTLVKASAHSADASQERPNSIAELVPQWVKDFRAPSGTTQLFDPFLAFLTKYKRRLPISIWLEPIRGQYSKPLMQWYRVWTRGLQEVSRHAESQQGRLKEALSPVPDWVTDWVPGSPHDRLMDFLGTNKHRLPDSVSLVADENGVLPEPTLILIRAWFLNALKQGIEEIGQISQEDVLELRKLVSDQPATGRLPNGEDVFSIPESLSAVGAERRAEAQKAMARSRARSRPRAIEERDDDVATVTDAPTELAHGSLTDIGFTPEDADVVGWRPGTGRGSTLKEFLTKPGQTDAVVKPNLLRQWVLGLQEESVEQTGTRLPTAIIIDLSGDLLYRGLISKWSADVSKSKSDDWVRLNLPPLVKEFRPRKGAGGIPNLWKFFWENKDALPLAIRLGLRKSYRNEGPIFQYALAWARIVQEESVSLTGMRISNNKLSTLLGMSINLRVLNKLSAGVEDSDSAKALEMTPDWVKEFRPGRNFSNLLSLLESKDAAGELPLAISPDLDDEGGRQHSQATMTWAYAYVLAVTEEDRQEGRPKRTAQALSTLTGGIANPRTVSDWLKAAERVTAARAGEGSGAPRETLEPVGAQGGDALGAVGGSDLGDTGSVSFDSGGAPFVVGPAREDLQVSRSEASAGRDHDVEMDDAPDASPRDGTAMMAGEQSGDGEPTRGSDPEDRGHDAGTAPAGDVSGSVPVPVEQRVEPFPGMDDLFPLLDSRDPKRVDEPYADDNGGVHPAVKRGADRITATMAEGKSMLKGIAEDPADPRLPAELETKMSALQRFLDERVAEELKRVVLGERLSSPRLEVGLVLEKHVKDHDQGLADGKQRGVWLTDTEAAKPGRRALAGSRIDVKGLYVGAALRTPEAKKAWKEKYRQAPHYTFATRSRGENVTHIAGEGRTNSVGFINAPTKPNVFPLEIDHSAVNSLLIPFKVTIPDKNGKDREDWVIALIVLDNAYDSVNNEDHVLWAEYSHEFFDGHPVIEEEEEEEAGSDHDAEMEDAPVVDATPLHETVRFPDQGRREVTFHDSGEDFDVRVTRVVEHSLRWDESFEMDYKLPWRDSEDPMNKVYWMFADERGRVHPAVLAGRDSITAKMAGGKRLLKELAARHGPTHPAYMSAKYMEGLWPQLESDVAQLVKGLVWEDRERGPEPRLVPVRMTAAHLPEHERAPLEGKWGAQLPTPPASIAPADRMSLRNGRVLGLYLGAVLNDEAADIWEKTYRLFPHYHIDPGGNKYTMSAEGAANAVAFANTALRPDKIDYDHDRINAVFIPFVVRIPDKAGKMQAMPIMALVALENLFDPIANPFGIITVDYGPLYLEIFKNMMMIRVEPEAEIKVEPEADE